MEDSQEQIGSVLKQINEKFESEGMERQEERGEQKRRLQEEKKEHDDNLEIYLAQVFERVDGLQDTFKQILEGKMKIVQQEMREEVNNLKQEMGNQVAKLETKL